MLQSRFKNLAAPCSRFPILLTSQGNGNWLKNWEFKNLKVALTEIESKGEQLLVKKKIRSSKVQDSTVLSKL